MIALDPELQPLRRAALRVHTLPEADARWLLDALSARERAALEPLLDELRALGLPRDPALLAGLELPARAPAPRCGNHLLARLDRRGLARLESLLRAEPRCIATAFLAAGPWPWRTRIARSLGIALPAQPRETPVAPALRDALLRTIGEALAVHPADARGAPARWCAALWARLSAARSAP